MKLLMQVHYVDILYKISKCNIRFNYFTPFGGNLLDEVKIWLMLYSLA